MTSDAVDHLDVMWQQQLNLNRLFRPDFPPTEFAERTALTKEIVLHLISECDELLRVSGSWQPHRNLRHRRVLENRPAVAFELTDIHKYVVMLYQIWGLTPDDAREYWMKKDMIVRQRYSEEFVKSIDRPSVLIDLDGVLANYIEGFVRFLSERLYALPPQVADDILTRGEWIDKSSLSTWISEDEYDRLRHVFRVTGGFGQLPMLPGARNLMDYLHTEGYYIIILTSRPIHLYPNIYSDTLTWLLAHDLHYDFIWWAPDKGTMIDDLNIQQHIKFAIDDDWKYVQQFANLNIPTYWISKKESLPPTAMSPLIKRRIDLMHVLEDLEHGAHV